MRTYYIRYKMNYWSDEKSIHVFAGNKGDAWDKAFYEVIPKLEGTLPFSAWVDSVKHNNGRIQRFNTSEGNPY